MMPNISYMNAIICMVPFSNKTSHKLTEVCLVSGDSNFNVLPPHYLINLNNIHAVMHV